MQKSFIIVLLSILFLCATLASAKTSYVNDSDTFIRKCSACHGTEIIDKKIKSKKEWKKTVDRMKRYGMKIDSRERNAVLNYLYKYRTK